MKLYELAVLMRAKNAGPFVLTIDVMFDDADKYRCARDSKVLSARRVSEIYGVPIDQVRYFECDDALALKVSFPRRVTSGSRGDTDVYGGQFHSPLVNLDVPH